MLRSPLSHSERSAARWARALYHAAYGSLPDELSTTPSDPLPPDRFQLVAYPGLRQQPLTVAISGIERDPSDASNALAFAARFERTLRLATAPLSARPHDDEPLASAIATATASGPAGLLTLREHEAARPASQHPWLEDDPVELHIPLPLNSAAGLLIPRLPITAVLASPIDGMRVSVELTPSHAALAARLTESPLPSAGPSAIWQGTIARCRPPVGFELRVAEEGRLTHLPFASAHWVASADRFALRIGLPTS